MNTSMSIICTNTNNASAVASAATVPRFVQAVYDMLQNEDQRILSWSADGSHFQVYDVPRLETEVLRKYFKHGKFSSFQRQLNNFGFHKWTKTRASVATFSHGVLVRCHSSQLAALVSQMQLKQKMTTATATTPVKAATSAKRPRSLLSSVIITENTAAVKKLKMSPRDVCTVDDLSHASLASILEPLWPMKDGNFRSTDAVLELDTLDSVDLVALDWDAVVTPLETSICHNNSNSSIKDSNCISDIDADIDFDLDVGFELDCAASSGLLTEADVSAVLGGLETAQALSDCELDALFRGASDADVDAEVNVDVDRMLSVSY